MNNTIHKIGIPPSSCRRCKKRPASDGRRTCLDCRTLSAAGETKRQTQWRREGKCTFCGADKDRTGCLCRKCAEKSKLHARKAQQERVSSGLCKMCGKLPFVSDDAGKRLSAMCQECYLKNAAGKHLGSYNLWPVLLDKLYRHDWRCVYTGEKLMMGKNLSFDHVDPICRFPERKHDPTNLEPVSFTVNLVKRHMTKNEFLGLVHTIENYTQN